MYMNKIASHISGVYLSILSMSYFYILYLKKAKFFRHSINCRLHGFHNSISISPLKFSSVKTFFSLKRHLIFASRVTERAIASSLNY